MIPSVPRNEDIAYNLGIAIDWMQQLRDATLKDEFTSPRKKILFEASKQIKDSLDILWDKIYL